MEIKYWADIACPYSYIGITRLKKALTELGIADQTPLKFMAFQLDPTLPTTTNLTMPQYYAKTHQLSIDEATTQLNKIDKLATDAGLTITMEKALPVNTLAAHRIIKYVETLGDQALLDKVVMRLYWLYFTANKSIANPNALISALSGFKLDSSAISDLLASTKYAKDVRNDERRAFMLGIPSAPLFVINNKYSITGAQPYQVFVKSLRKIKQEA